VFFLTAGDCDCYCCHGAASGVEVLQQQDASGRTPAQLAQLRGHIQLAGELERSRRHTYTTGSSSSTSTAGRAVVAPEAPADLASAAGARGGLVLPPGVARGVGKGAGRGRGQGAAVGAAAAAADARGLPEAQQTADGTSHRPAGQAVRAANRPG